MKYLLAISGGVDSAVLLDQFAKQYAPEQLVVAHFDHGMRPESAQDADFVQKLAQQYGVATEVGRARLGQGASEAQARRARYEFLRKTAEQVGADRIVTAHHQDDLLETIVMNLIRGTGWRGLAPMSSDLARPLLDRSKAELMAYALQHDLEWAEDETNSSPQYFRNRVRRFLQRMTTQQRQELLNLYQKQRQIRDTTNQILVQNIVRHSITEVPQAVWADLPPQTAAEILNYLTHGHLTRDQLQRTLEFMQTAQNGKKMIYKRVKLQVSRDTITIYELH